MNHGVYLIGAFHEMVELLEDLSVPIKGLIDCCEANERCCRQYPVLGDDEWLLARGPHHVDRKVVLTPDSPIVRKKLFLRYRERGFEFPVIVGGSVSRYAVVGDGCVIQKDAYVSAGCNVGDAVKINLGAKVMHDSVVGNFVTIAPSAVVLGHVTIGDSAYIGANATLLPYVEIGEGAVVGAGAVVTKSVEPNAVVKGVPAKANP